jgi:peptidoglycan/xylan/chitin deacetylase (PgdA/CDA1 family)
MSRKDVLLTFDYELFLGKQSGTIENCLIKPTQLLLEILKKHGAKGIFFIDTLYLLRLEQENTPACKKQLETVLSQLHDIKKQGHTIGVHIHPHWLDAQYTTESNNWNGEIKTRFALSNLSDADKQTAISKSVNILQEFLEPDKPITYRAGGFYCQPFSSFSNFFEQHKILIDFSAMREFKSIGYKNLYSFDFTNPPEEYIYKFNENPILKVNSGIFTEVSINSFKLSGITKIRNSIYYRLNKNKVDFVRIGDGSGSGNTISHVNDASIKRYIRNDQTFSIELMNPIIAQAYASYLRKNDYVHFVSHPKLFTPIGLQSFDLFLGLIKTLNIEYDYTKIIANRLSS